MKISTTSENNLKNILRLTGLSLLAKGDITKDELEKELLKVKIPLLFAYDDDCDCAVLAQELFEEMNITGGTSAVLEDNENHIEWLMENRSSIPWQRWKNYSWYLQSERLFPSAVVSSIDDSTSEVLRRLENPQRPGSWYRRGMVVGDIQSGKTANYIGLINKAADAGYKCIIVLAGLNNDLRSQTQKRVDEGFIGIDSRKKDLYQAGSARIGVGKRPTQPASISLTGASINGDYKKSVHTAVTFGPGSQTVIAVVKKNVTPLTNLFQSFFSQTQSGTIRDWPLLLIDDEADNASINTKAKKHSASGRVTDETDPTRINGLIRKILGCFEKKAYVGYTATPFANIFIHPEYYNDGYGADLYPKDFIINLHPSSNYFGPKQVFGLPQETSGKFDPADPLPITRSADDIEEIFPKKHKKDLLLEGIPDSMKKAVLYFIAASAVKIYRGMNQQHNSMLIHVTRYVDVQAQLTSLLRQMLKEIVSALEFRTGPQYEELMASFSRIWNDDLVPTSSVCADLLEKEAFVLPSWQEAQDLLYEAASRIEVKSVNGEAADGNMDYDSYPSGCWVIAVGGDKLSRGLTLEGLTVSYYARLSAQYDTLLQMGRWFGYRNKYEDLCRLYSTEQLLDWYQDITLASEELRSEFDSMASLGETPLSYGLRVRTHPDGLKITAANKMRNSEKFEITFSGKLIETVKFFRSDPRNAGNIRYLSQWIQNLDQNHGTANLSKNGHIWNQIPARDVLEFLKNIELPEIAGSSDSRIVRQYIENELKEEGLLQWTVALISVKSREEIDTAGKTIGLSWRTDANPEGGYVKIIRRHLISPSHEAVDLTEPEYSRALEWTKRNAKNQDALITEPSGIAIRRFRPRERGLLLIYAFQSGIKKNKKLLPYQDVYLGYALSFPESYTAQPLSYTAGIGYADSILSDQSEQ